MALFKFDDFSFDSTRYQLTYKRQRVSLRPKALRLLGLLIENRERVVSKAEIFACVWGSDYQRDHLLFQLVSELRRAPFNSEFLRTQPNEGYQWNVATRLVRSKGSVPLQLAASLMLGLTLLGVSSLPFNEDVTPPEVTQLPAHNAFSKGVIALDRGQRDEAVEWFKFALNENPESIESSLFLAEALFQQNRQNESSAYLQALLQKPELDPYNKMTATDLLSRIRLRQGRLSEALKYAHESSRTGVVAQCTVDVVQQRFELLSDQLGASQVAGVTLKVRKVSTDIEIQNVPKNYDDQCEKLKPALEETSSCEPNEELKYLVDSYRLASEGIS